jgi:hypothetical protein
VDDEPGSEQAKENAVFVAFEVEVFFQTGDLSQD